MLMLKSDPISLVPKDSFTTPDANTKFINYWRFRNRSSYLVAVGDDQSVNMSVIVFRLSLMTLSIDSQKYFSALHSLYKISLVKLGLNDFSNRA